MKNPKQLETLIEGAAYSLPKYKVVNEGIADAGEVQIYFCKGNKEDEKVMRQEGIFTESLLVACGKYLQDNNKGDLENEFTTKAIEDIKSALGQLQARADDRKARTVQTTYNK